MEAREVALAGVVLVVEAEAAVGETSVFSFKKGTATSERAVNSHTRLLEAAVVEGVSGEVEIMAAAKHLEDLSSRHTADSRDKVEEGTSPSKEAEVDMANLWVPVEVIPNKAVLLVTVSQIVLEDKAVSQVVTVLRAAVSHLVMVVKAVSHPVMVPRAVSQPVMVPRAVNHPVTAARAHSQVVTVVEVVNKVATVEADTAKDRRVATPSLWEVEDIISNRARLLPEDMVSPAAKHNKEAGDQITLHPKVFIANNLVDIQVAVRIHHREEEEVLLVAMEHHLEEEDGLGDIPNIEETLTMWLSVFTYFLPTFGGTYRRHLKTSNRYRSQGCWLIYVMCLLD